MASRMVIPDTAFSVSRRRTKRPRVGGAAHLEFIRSLPCLVTGATSGVQAAHISYAEPKYGKLGRGYGTKEEDCWTVPLGHNTHELQHRQNERKFWQSIGIDPCVVALALWRCSGDYETALLIIEMARQR